MAIFINFILGFCFGTYVYSDNIASEVHNMAQDLAVLLHHSGNRTGSQSTEHISSVKRLSVYKTEYMVNNKSQCSQYFLFRKMLRIAISQPAPNIVMGRQGGPGIVTQGQLLLAYFLSSCLT